MDYLDDIDADFLAIYGIDLESADMSGPRFFKLSTRLPAYSGVMKIRLENMRQEQEERAKPMSPAEYVKMRKAQDPNFKTPINADEMDLVRDLIEMN